MKHILLLIILSFTGTSAFACTYDDVQFNTNFSGARLSSCTQKTADRYELNVVAENYPINHSPWYAFKVVSSDNKKIKITMLFKNKKPRYHPKISLDGKMWESIPFKIKKGKLSFSLNVSQKPLWVSGQELIVNEDYLNWLEKVEKNSEANLSELGRSSEGRTILQLESIAKNKKEWLIILGRQHPPEVTGALAIFPFSHALFLKSELSQKFRERFNILLIPNLNPDGVEHGNWRHNINGADLNRDWGKFEQRETQLVKQKLDKITDNGGRIIFALDFHSTFRDALYTMPRDYGVNPPMLVENWVKRLHFQLEDFSFLVKPGNNKDNGVSKQYFADEYKVHAVTYEMGDNTDRATIKKVAKIAATSLMQQLLATPSTEFIRKKEFR